MLCFRCEKLCPLGRTFFYFYGAKNYGGKGHLSLRNRGGVSLFYALSAYSKGDSVLPALSSLVVNFQSIGANFRQKGSKVNIYLLAFVFSRDFRRPKRAKFKIYLDFEVAGASVVALSLGRWWCPLGGRWSALVARPAFVPCSMPFVPFLLCLWCIASEYGSISHFKGVFRGFGGLCRVLLSWWLSSCPLVRRCAVPRGFRTCHRLALVLR